MDSRRLPAFERMMIFSSMLSFGFLFYRCIFTENFHYTFLLWNLVVAFAPYIISRKLANKNTNLVNYSLLFGWLIFFPVCVYPLTDLFQIKKTDSFSMVYDALMFFFFAISALLPGLISLKNVESFLKRHMSGFFTKISLFVFIFLSSYNACLVQFLHLKSWNIIVDFRKMVFASEHGILDPVDHLKILSIVIGLVLFIDVLYAGFKKITSQSLKIRS